MKIQDYKNIKSEVEVILKELNKKSNLISWIRVGLFLAIVAFLCYGYFNKNSVFYIFSVALLIVFFVVAKVHSKIDNEIKYNESKVNVYDRYIKRLDGSWYGFEDKGYKYLDENEMYLKDLDIFGDGSLYQYICSANTIYGKKSLVNHLKNKDCSIEDIVKYQNSVKELSNMQEFSNEIETLSYMIKQNKKKNINNEIKKFIDICEKEIKNKSKIARLFMVVLPAVLIASSVLSLLGVNTLLNFTIARTILVVNILIAFANFQKSTAILSPVGDFYKNLKVYENIFKKITEVEFKSQYLKEQRDMLIGKVGALKALNELNKIGEYISLRQNFVGNLILNGLFLWDFQCIDMFNKWKQSYGKNMNTYLEVVGELEALISLASISYLRDDYVFPNILNEDVPTLNFKNLKHPLIKIEDAVGNDVNLSSKTCIITGSNMSGKTTFLRSIGINLVLAYAGAPVLASEFDTSVMKIFTSIRVEDNVNKGISTFYAELLRIKNMTQYNENKKMKICLIDEIFKGTNSADRIICATETIKKLSNKWSLTLVSTHDFELCELENDETIQALNYHFAEYYENGEINFDYLIRDGRCITTNAKVLLKMVGIVD